jgi:hypothetical protein
MAPNKLPILGGDIPYDIDSGTSVRGRHFPPGISIDAYAGGCFLSRSQALFEDRLRWERRRLIALRAYRDSIISYDVDKRVDSLSRSMKGKIRKKKDGVKTYVPKKTRPLTDIDSLVLHATATSEMSVERYWDLSVHFVIPPDGTIHQSHDENIRCHGSNGFNKRSVAVEFVGHFKGGHDRHGNEKWNKDNEAPHMMPTTQQIESGRNLVRYLKKAIGIKYVLAHSQAAKKTCPGPEIWYNVGEWAINNKLSADGRGIKENTGSPIPKDYLEHKWDVKNWVLAPDI